VVILEDGRKLGDFVREQITIRDLEDIIRHGEVSCGFLEQGKGGARTPGA
jgi:hypothetical protein